jgi:predicted MFS family arabinose efflux permease
MTNAFIFIPTFTFMGLFIEGHLHAAKFWIGLTVATGGLSGTIGTLIIGSRPPPRRRIKVMYAAWITAGVAALIYCVATSIWVLMILPLVMFPLLSLGNIIWETMLQKETPPEMLGRVASADWFVSLAISPPGIAIAGALIGAFGFTAYFAVAVVVCELPCFVAMFSRTVNMIDWGRTTVVKNGVAAPVDSFVPDRPAEMAPPPLTDAGDLNCDMP